MNKYLKKPWGHVATRSFTWIFSTVVSHFCLYLGKNFNWARNLELMCARAFKISSELDQCNVEDVKYPKIDIFWEF